MQSFVAQGDAGGIQVLPSLFTATNHTEGDVEAAGAKFLSALSNNVIRDGRAITQSSPTLDVLWFTDCRQTRAVGPDRLIGKTGRLNDASKVMAPSTAYIHHSHFLSYGLDVD